MPHVMTISALAVASAISAVVGTQLGRDTIAQINPLFFTELPETRAWVDETPYPFQVRQPDPAQYHGYWRDSFNVGGRPACLDCPTNFVDPPYAAPEPTPRTARQSSEDEVLMEFERSSRELDRYSSFPITEEEARLPYEREAYAVRTSPQSESGEGGSPPVGM